MERVEGVVRATRRIARWARRGTRRGSALGIALPLAAAPSGCAPDSREPVVQVVEPDGPVEAPLPAGASDGPLTEPFLAVNPATGSNAIVGVIAPSLDRAGPWRCAAISTVDGARSWRRTDFPDMERCIDPWVVCPGPDSALLTALEIRSDSVEEGRFRLVMYRSGDRGLSWAGPDTLGRGFEHPIVHVERSGRAQPGADPARTPPLLLAARRMSRGPRGDLLHRVYLARSSDRGRTFQRLSETRPAATGPNTTEITPTGLVSSGGALIVGTVGGGRAWALRSDDGGRSFAAAYPITDGCAVKETEIDGAKLRVGLVRVE